MTEAHLVDTSTLPTWTFDWGIIKPLVSTDSIDDAGCSQMHVTLLPGKGHDRHHHPDSDEVLYVLAGRGDQMVDDREPFPVVPGDTIWIPRGVFHSTRNTSHEAMVILATYAPAGAEQALEDLPDFRTVEPGHAPTVERP